MSLRLLVPFVIRSTFDIAAELFFDATAAAWCLGLRCWSRRFHFTSACWPPPFSSTKEIPVGWGPLAGLPWIPPPRGRALPSSTNFVGTSTQAHLLVMSLNVAEYNLGKVNIEAKLVSSFSSYTGGSPLPLAGARRAYAVACLRFFAECCCNSLLFAYHFVLWFFHPPPSPS